jgi:hypothetical protein
MSLCARGKAAFRRRLDAAGLRPVDRATRQWSGRRADAGFGIVEAVVSVALLAIIIAPITHLVVTTESASNNMHLRAEAGDLATQALETAQYQTANGVNPTAGLTTSTQYSGNDPFTVSLDWELAAGTGTSNVCIASPGQPSSRIWTVTATVSWGKVGGQKGSVALTTLVSPALADLADTNAAEIAVPIYNSDDSTLETTVPISISVVGSCTGSQCSGETVPGNEHTTESGNTGSTGCAVFSNLFAGAGWTYSVTATPPSPYVDPSELSAAPTAPGLPVRTAVSVQSNTVTVVANPNIILAPGALMTVEFATENFVSGSSDPGVLPAPYLPISVESSTLLCTTIAPNTCVVGNGTAAGGFSYASPQVALLYPGPTVTGSVPNYSAWAGDQADSIPTYTDPNGDAIYSPDLPTTFQAVANGAGTLTLPVYPLSLKLTVLGAAGTVTSMTVEDAGGGGTFNLNPTSGSTYANNATSATGLPLGQYEIFAADTGGNTTVSPNYVWILPSGVCTATGIMTGGPPSSCTPSTSAIPVTVG